MRGRLLDQAIERGAQGQEFDQLEKMLDELNPTVADKDADNSFNDPVGKVSENQEPPQDQLQPLLNLYSQGQLQQALVEAKQLLQRFSNSVTLHNICGAANAGLGQFGAAIDSYRQALKIKPDFAEAYNNMGIAQQDKGDINGAITSYKQAIRLQPSYANAYNNMGNALREKGDLEAAINSYKCAIKLKPDDANVYNNMGNARRDEGNLEVAIESYKQALKLKPNLAEAHYNIGSALEKTDGLDAAIDSFKRAIKIKPDYAEARYNMGNALKSKGDLDAAMESYQQAIKIKPDYAEAYFNMGNALRDMGYLAEAIKSYKQAIKIKPNYSDSYNNMGNAIKDTRDLDAAMESYKQAIKFKSDYAEAYFNMGNALRDKGNTADAIGSFKRAIKLKPDYAQAYNNIGLALKDKGDLETAIHNFKQALKIKPDYAEAQSLKLFHQSLICDWTAIECDRNNIPTLGILTSSIEPLSVLSLEDAPERHRLRAELFAKNTYKQQPLPPHQKPTSKPRRLRIGYFSADFQEHPVSYLMAKVFEVHDRNCFEVYGYSIGPAKEGRMRQRLIKSFDKFDDVQGMSNKDIALLARQDKIDIAIDLTGYTKNNRAGIFAYRAAPIQINYLGYPGTMGADFIDYIIVDQIMIPQDSRKFYSEKPIYLPHSFSSDNTMPIAEQTPTRSDLGLPEKAFVFCALHNSYKISPSEFNIWMRLLKHVDGSVLWLLESNRWMKSNLIKEAKIRGVDPDRLVFAKHTSHEEYLAQFRQADLQLDTFNITGGSTSNNALWAGLPVLTKLGKSYGPRITGSLLTAIGFPELMTTTEAEYEALALKLATNPKLLSKIRQRLDANRLSAPLFDTESFTKHLEEGYQKAYQRYFDGKEPDVIYLGLQSKASA